MNVFSLIPPPWGTVLKIAGPVVLAVGLYGTGFIQGSHHQKVVTQTKTITKTLKQIEYRDKVSQPKEAAQVKDNNTRHDEAILALPGVTISLPAVCDWGPDTIGVLNRARELPAQP